MARKSTLAGFCLPVLVFLLSAGCMAPKMVSVPHPDRVDPDTTLADLQTMYTASADDDPAGLGPWDLFYHDSSFTLSVWEMERRELERDRIAFARTPEEHAAKLEQEKGVYRQFVVFQGELTGRFKEGVSARAYENIQGIYLLDDTGRKFYPVSMEDNYKNSVEGNRLYRQKEGDYTFKERNGDAVTVYTAYPRLIFPGEALTAKTRSVSLFFASGGRLAKFSWVFEGPNRAVGGSPGETRRGAARMWRMPK